MLATTTSTQIVNVNRSQFFERVVKMVCDSVTSEHSKRAYEHALIEFLTWYDRQPGQELNKAAVLAYVEELRRSGLGAVSINQRITAIRKLALEAVDNGLLQSDIAAGILRVKGERKEGKRLGNWLSGNEAQGLINAPDITTLKGQRDRSLFAVLLGCGLRRAECASLTFEHIQQREGRWVIVDLVGKRNKTRSIPMPAFAKAALDSWAAAAGIEAGRVFRPINKGGRMCGESMTAQSIYDTLTGYTKTMSADIAPHDLRRTFAKLARKGGADLKQIQLTLGHASVKTTEIYLGEEQNLTDAPCDRLGLKL